MLNIEQFRATRREIMAGRVEMPDHVNDMIIGDSSISSVFIYDAETWIAKRHDGKFWLILERDEYVSDSLPELESLLFAWWQDQCNGESV